MAAHNPSVSQAMTVEPARMHQSFEDYVDLCLISSVVPLLLTWLPISMYTVYQKFMQLAPPCSWLREFQTILAVHRLLFAQDGSLRSPQLLRRVHPWLRAPTAFDSQSRHTLTGEPQRLNHCMRGLCGYCGP